MNYKIGDIVKLTYSNYIIYLKITSIRKGFTSIIDASLYGDILYDSREVRLVHEYSSGPFFAFKKIEKSSMDDIMVEEL